MELIGRITISLYTGAHGELRRVIAPPFLSGRAGSRSKRRNKDIRLHSCLKECFIEAALLKKTGLGTLCGQQLRTS